MFLRMRFFLLVLRDEFIVAFLNNQLRQGMVLFVVELVDNQDKNQCRYFYHIYQMQQVYHQ